MSAHEEITCHELVELVSDHLEGLLAPAERRRLEQHLQGCPFCAQYVVQMRQTIAALGTISAESIAPDKRGQLLAAFRGRR